MPIFESHLIYSQKTIGRLQLDIAVLREQKAALVTQVEEIREDSKRRQEAAATTIRQRKDCIAQQDAAHALAIYTIRERADNAERNLAMATCMHYISSHQHSI